jgi:hypothetical protein
MLSGLRARLNLMGNRGAPLFRPDSALGARGYTDPFAGTAGQA